MTAREPLTVVEIRQPRCALTWGSYPCTAGIAQGSTRTNLALRSEEIDNATWTKTGMSVSANSLAVPLADSAIFDTIIESGTSALHNASQSITISVGVIYTFSVYAKIASGSRQLTLNATSTAFGTAQSCRFDSTGAVIASSGGSSASVQDLGGGFYRFVMTTIAATGTGGVFRLVLSNGSGNTPTYTGDGTSGWYVFGVQVEAGSSVSDYKATAGSAVTRLFGTASTYCYQTWATCPTAATRAAMVLTDWFRWRFMADRSGVHIPGDFSDDTDIAIPAIPVPGLRVSSSPAGLNVAGIMEGKSPFGIKATATVSMSDFVWSDPWGDNNKALRTTPPTRFFWQTFLARNRFFNGFEMVIYDGYVGDDLDDMRQRLFLVDGIDGPSGGEVTIYGSDPLAKARGKMALFPPAMDMALVLAIGADDTTIRVETDTESNLSSIMGITTDRHVRIGDEIISYAAYSEVSTGIYDLTGCVRAVGGTTAKEASIGTKVTRVGHFHRALLADAALYLLTDWTQVGASRIDTAGWATETAEMLSTVRTTDAWVTEATPVEGLMGELCQQGCFMVWWDEWSSLVRMKAVGPAVGSVQHLTDASGVIADSASLEMLPDDRLSRVFVYCNPADATKITRAGALAVYARVAADYEVPEAGGEDLTLEVVSRWLPTRTLAGIMIARTLIRTQDIPRLLTVDVAAKDREIVIGDIIDVTTRQVVDSDGNPVKGRWEVISATPVMMGQTYRLTLQDFGYTGRFAFWMPAGSDYGGTASADREPGFFWCNDDGLMPDGTDGYAWH
jgi:hypothetical protein